MSLHSKRLKLITFTVDAVAYECQVKTWSLDPGIADGERLYSFCPDGEAIEETDPEPTLELEFYSDWRSAGISEFLWLNSGTDVAFVLDHHPDDAASHVRFEGTVKIKAAPVGGEARTTEMTSITLQVVGPVTFTENAAIGV